MRDFEKLVLLLVIGFCIAAGCNKPQHGGQTSPKRLDELVKFSVPQRWQVMKQEDTTDLRRILFYIPYPPAEGTRHSANAFIIIRHCPINMKVRDIDVSTYHKGAEGYIIVSDVMDGDKWRTVFSEANDELPYVFMERFGVEQGVSVYFNVTFPLIKEKDAEWREKMTDEYNKVVQSLEFVNQR